MAVRHSSTYVTLNLSKFQEFPKRFERSEAVERLERFELAPTYVKGGSMDSQEISNRLDE